MDNVDTKTRSLVMQKIRSENTGFERTVITGLRKARVSFSLHPGLFGTPDIVSKRKRVVVFLDSCFWHGCRWHCRIPKSRRSYWINKIQYNKDRARTVNRVLRREGWSVFRFWEHQFKKDFDATIKRLARIL